MAASDTQRIAPAFRLDDASNLIYIPVLHELLKVKEDLYSSLPDSFSVTYPTSNVPGIRDLAPALTLILTENCNLHCVYCYEDQKRRSSLMARPIAQAAIQHLVESAVNYPTHEAKLHFFGGEPTLALALMRGLLEEFRCLANVHRVCSKAAITTNGVMQEEAVGWIAKEIDAVTISLDGPLRIQEENRPGSFARTFQTAKALFERRPDTITFRATTRCHQFDSLEDVVDFFLSEFPGCRLHVEPASGEFHGFLDRWLAVLSHYGDSNIRLRTSVDRPKSVEGGFCGGSGRNIVVAADGALLACHRFATGVGTASSPFSYGCIVEKQLHFERERLERIESYTSASLVACRSCFAIDYCRGDCPALRSVDGGGHLTWTESPRCEEVRRFVKGILLSRYEKAARADANCESDARQPDSQG
jgi:uncharacterized protein